MGWHVKRASRQKIAWLRKKLGPLIEGRMRAGYTVSVVGNVLSDKFQIVRIPR